MENVEHVYAHSGNTFAITERGELYCWSPLLPKTTLNSPVLLGTGIKDIIWSGINNCYQSLTDERQIILFDLDNEGERLELRDSIHKALEIREIVPHGVISEANKLYHWEQKNSELILSLRADNVFSTNGDTIFIDMDGKIFCSTRQFREVKLSGEVCTVVPWFRNLTVFVALWAILKIRKKSIYVG